MSQNFGPYQGRQALKKVHKQNGGKNVSERKNRKKCKLATKSWIYVLYSIPGKIDRVAARRRAK
jgi:hypothetical protein